MSDNLTLWRQIERTDPAQTKKITGKSYQGNSPKPHFLIFKATETFGPCGIGWGFEIVEEKLLDGALLEPGFNERIHMARVRVWYEWSGKRGQVEHVGQTIFCGRRKSDGNKPGAPFTDEDAPKKSVTDALIKALSMIGFAGDIFMGRYDDSKYVRDLTEEFAEERRVASRPAEVKPGNGSQPDLRNVHDLHTNGKPIVKTVSQETSGRMLTKLWTMQGSAVTAWLHRDDVRRALDSLDEVDRHRVEDLAEERNMLGDVERAQA